MTNSYLCAVGASLNGLGRRDRRRALEALAAQLDELAEAGIAPAEALGAPADYATELIHALEGDAPGQDPQFRVFGLPVEARGLTRARVRSRAWNPEDPALVVPRLFGAGWTVNLGSLAVKLRLIRPDDATSDVFEQIPERTVRSAQVVPFAIGVAAASGLALAWNRLPEQVAAKFDLGGRPRRTASKYALLMSVATGLIPAVWAMRRSLPVDERLTRAASGTTLASVSAAAVAVAVLQDRYPVGRWGFLLGALLPAGFAASLAVILVPLRAGLRRAWRSAGRAPGSTRTGG